MTRFGVMKHLKVLEEAGLVTTQRRGREKLHFLNPVPIRLVHDRWVSKYAEPWAAALSELKRDTRGGRPMERRTAYAVVDGRGTMTVFEIYIKTTPERLWEAITDPEMREKYSFGVGTDSDWTPGSRLQGGGPGRGRHRRGREPRGRPAAAARAELHGAVERGREGAKATSRVTWEIEPVGELVPADGHPRPAPRRRQLASSTAAGR